ncbi:methylmalonyl-CoA mutase family protein [Paenisporosarcina indica]|uniref:methylmalonyl-CoA mutase family protein n=1 Tax=Paenisporosarcina indica TaxID=650093 RepID=UPI00094FFD33|nr:methylmalonyl-CoA mutase family protein [Paenisporosarcina indica]
MSINEMKSAIFQKVSFETWKSIAVSTLKGKPFEKLITPTFEGIDLQPLYTAEHLQKTMNFSMVVSNAKQQTRWLLAQRTYGNSAREFLHKAKEQLKLGNEMIVYVGSSTSFTWSEDELQELAALLKEHPFYFTTANSNDEITRVFSLFSMQELEGLYGYFVGTSPSIGRTVVSTSELHHAGGSAVHELTYALIELSKIANSQADFTSKVAVKFSVDTNFFMEIAKLRAFRVLWKAFSKAYDAPPVPIVILAENSLRSYSKLDSNVNLLRAGNAAFSAVLGGADIITVHPHDVLTGSTAISERIARNVQLVIREETMVNKIMDPAAGSYYVESLTAELIEQAWTLFLTVLELNPDEQTNYILTLAKEVQVKREQELANRKASLIGTNIYANPVDEVSETINGSNIERLAQPYEQLRKHFTDNPLKTAVVSFGILKDVKPRADFIKGFLQAGGLNPKLSPVFTTAVDAWHWVKTNKIEYVVFAAKDEVVNDVFPDFLRQADHKTIIDVAGKFQDENVWKELGLNGTIYAGQNLVEKMEHLIEIQKKGK